ncbi:MAG TPA: hypothetical protein VLU94_02540 [Candidatus Nitrosotalea sp.]|nr:hypothetical protein [Candidatus Nitrosotalea sp.]
MKRFLSCLVPFAVAAGVFAVTGCNTVSTTTTQSLGVPAYPPTNPTNVVILLTPPTRPHIRLGNVQAEPYSTSVSATKIQSALQDAAAKLGADAVVIVYDRTQTVGAVVTGPWWGRSVEGIQGRVIIGVAIKYTGP